MSDEELSDVLGVIAGSNLSAADKGTLSSYFRLTNKRAEQMTPAQLQQARHFAGLSLGQAALLLGVSWEALQDIEVGVTPGAGVGCWPRGLCDRIDKVYGLGDRGEARAVVEVFEDDEDDA